jgi:hypothetical protein
MAEVVPHDKPATQVVSPARGTAWNNRVFFILFYAIAVFVGVRKIWFWKQSPIDLLIPLVFAFCLAVWALEDARRRKYRIPSLSKPWFFLLAILVVPGYVIWSRGWRGLGWVALHAFCWFFLGVLVQQIGGTIVFGAQWWQMVAQRAAG